MLRTWSGTFVFLLALAARAAAQDYGATWTDRVTHALVDDATPLADVPLEIRLAGGELYSYDTNIYLRDRNEKADSIWITFVQAGLKYAEPEWDAEVDLAANYNAYARTPDAGSDEERFFGRVRYQGSRVAFSVAQILRRESSPSDIVFIDRVPRFLSNSTPLLIVHATDVLTFELQSDIQHVRFNRRGFETAENTNARTSLTMAYRTEWNDVEALLQGGHLTIDYRLPTAVDANGFYARGGLRGDIVEGLQAILLAGVTRAESDNSSNQPVHGEHTTMDVETHLAWSAAERTTVYAGYSRRIALAVGGASFQVVDSAGLSAQRLLQEDVTVRGRLQYERVHGPFVVTRAYYSGSVGAEVRVHPNVLVDGGATYRRGAALTTGGGGDFRDVIVSIGVAVTFQ